MLKFEKIIRRQKVKDITLLKDLRPASVMRKLVAKPKGVEVRNTCLWFEIEAGSYFCLRGNRNTCVS